MHVNVRSAPSWSKLPCSPKIAFQLLDTVWSALKRFCLNLALHPAKDLVRDGRDVLYGTIGYKIRE